MNYRTERQSDMLKRVQVFLASHPELAEVASSIAGTSVAEMIGRLVDHDKRQDDGARASYGATARKHISQQDLVLLMRTVASAARLKRRESTAMAEFRMPRVGLSLDRTITAARGMSEAARRNEAVLLSAGLKPQFIDELNAAIEAVQESVNDRELHLGSRSNATASMKAISSDIQHLLGVLDGLVLPLIAKNSGLLAEWGRAKRIGKKPGGAGDQVSDTALAPATSTPIAVVTSAPVAPTVAADTRATEALAPAA